MAAHRGWNVIDTASNYRGGRGERAIGYALTALHDQLGLTREMLFISTKAGFLQDEVKNQVKHCWHFCLTSNALMKPTSSSSWVSSSCTMHGFCA